MTAHFTVMLIGAPDGPCRLRLRAELERRRQPLPASGENFDIIDQDARAYRIFRSVHPGTPAFPLDKDLAADLSGAYSLPMQQILPLPPRARGRVPRRSRGPGEAPEFNPADHRDPADLNAQFINGVRQPRAEQGL
jgi:hypothetical protein